MAGLSPEIKIEEAKDALARSGYLLEGRTERALDDLDYFAEANRVYLDPETGKQREIDITALSALKTGPADFDYLFCYLVIEYLNNLQPLVFFNKDTFIEHTYIYDVKFSGLPVKIIDNSSWIWVGEFLRLEKYHHYCKGRIATQYCTFQKKRGTRRNEWMAHHDETHHGVFRKLCDYTTRQIDDHYMGFKPRRNDKANLQIYYPIVVTQGKLMSATEKEGKLELEEANYVHFVQSRIISNKEEDFHIDITTEQHFRALHRYDQRRNEVHATEDPAQS